MSGESEMKKPIVAVDIDEVLALYVPALIEFHNERYDSKLAAETFHSYEFHEVWGGNQAECSAKLDLFIVSSHFRETLKPVEGAYDALLQLKTHFDLHIVTSRQNKVRDDTVQWIDKHFPGIFSGIHLGNHYSSEGKTRTKSEICHSIGACLLIDDSVKYAIQCVHDNIPVILFGNYAWNQIKQRPDDIRFLDYDKDFSSEADSSVFNKISSDVNTSIREKFNLSCGSGSYYNVYRVRDWSEVSSLVSQSFGLPN